MPGRRVASPRSVALIAAVGFLLGAAGCDGAAPRSRVTPTPEETGAAQAPGPAPGPGGDHPNTGASTDATPAATPAAGASADASAEERADGEGAADPEPAPDADPIADATARGYSDARAAIAAGEPRILSYGLPEFEAGEMDLKTGLPYERRGCEVDDVSSAHAAAFNGEIRRAVAAGELDDVSLRRKVTTRAAIEARFAKNPGVEIAAGRGTQRDPTGRFAVEIAPDPETDAELEFNELWVADLRTGKRRYLTLCLFEGPARVLFSEDGETLYLRAEWDGQVCIQTHDLPRALFMQGWVRWESEDDESSDDPEDE